MKEDIVSLKWNAMNSRSMFSGEVIPTASSYFRTSGGVEGVWDDPANKVYSGSFHPASGKSVRFRHG
jgi:hypothetical protein